jgi:hypothetical protein
MGEDSCYNITSYDLDRKERFGSVLVTFAVTQNLVLIVEMSE